jgi:integrase
MAQPYLRRNRWYLKYKDAAGRWQDKVCDAKTKGQAVELQREVQVAEDRARHGLDQRPPKDGGGTVDELVEWWVESFLAKRASYAQCIGTIRKHIIGSKLGGRRLVDVRSGHVEAFLEEKAADFSSETLNHLRGYLGRAFNVAIRTQRFTGSNPVSKVPKRKIPRKLPDYLRPEEVVPVLANVPSRWRCLFATALYTGMRKGELLGLRKEDVDLSARLITIRRSHDRDTTKGGHADAVPIAAELLPYLETAIAASATDLVFPGRDGHLLSRRVQLEQVLRRALRRANILTGYRHTCRRKGCGHVEHAPDGSIRRCPKCSMKLWPVGQVRPIRFHHIRHTTASLLMMAGADLPAVQRIMRHTDPRITTEFYGHLAPGYLRNAIDRLAFEATPTEPTQRVAVASAPLEPALVAALIPEFAAPLLQARKTGDREPSDASEKGPRFRCLPRSGREDSNLRHSAPKADALPGCATPRGRHILHTRRPAITRLALASGVATQALRRARGDRRFGARRASRPGRGGRAGRPCAWGASWRRAVAGRQARARRGTGCCSCRSGRPRCCARARRSDRWRA